MERTQLGMYELALKMKCNLYIKITRLKYPVFIVIITGHLYCASKCISKLRRRSAGCMTSIFESCCRSISSCYSEDNLKQPLIHQHFYLQGRNFAWLNTSIVRNCAAFYLRVKIRKLWCLLQNVVLLRKLWYHFEAMFYIAF